MALKIHEIKIDTLKTGEVCQQIETFIKNGGQHLIVTANPEMVMVAKKDSEFKHVLNKADIVTADGIGLVIAAKILGYPAPERVTGIDLIQQLFRIGSEKGYKFYFLGAKEGVVDKVKDRLETEYPGINIVGLHNGYFKDDSAIMEEISRTGPDILLVGMGMAKQEKWLWTNKEKLNCPVSIGVGGSFDVLAGVVKRAPVWMRNFGLEWLYRLFQEPVRLRRMLVLPVFLLSIMLERIKGTHGGKDVQN